MMLCELTPAGGNLIRCAMSDFADIHLWRSYIVSLPSVKLTMPNRWGGFAAPPDWADLAFSPDMFVDADIWPPPETATVKLRWITDGDETGGTIIFDGTATVEDPGLTAIKYKLRRPENTTTVAESTVYNDTLANVMTTLCGASYLNLTIDTTRARIPSPAVSYTTTSEQLTIELATSLCAFFGHGFYVEGGTLYLIDMYDLTTTQRTVNEWDGDITESTYKHGTRYSTAKCGDYSVASSTVTNGEELSISTAYHGTQANIESALAIILEIANRPIVELDAMIGDNPLTVGGCYVCNDNNHAMPLQLIMVASDVVYNFDNETMQAVGAGSVTAI